MIKKSRCERIQQSVVVIAARNLDSTQKTGQIRAGFKVMLRNFNPLF